jgi:hypothetical protein
MRRTQTSMSIFGGRLPGFFLKRRMVVAVAAGSLWAATAIAQIQLTVGTPSPISPEVRKMLDPEFKKQLPRATPQMIERAEAAFFEHLHGSSESATNSLLGGRIDKDDLVSRIDVFVGDHPELGQTSPGSSEGPRAVILDALKREPDLARSETERAALADRFLARIGQSSGSARDTLLAGKMPADEIQSRINVFAADIRAERSRVVTDPAVAAVPAIQDAFEKANLGPAPERADSICYRGTVNDGKATIEFVVFKRRPDLMRLHIMKEGLVEAVLAYDGTKPWGEAPGKPAVIVRGVEAADIVQSSRYDDALVGYRERGTQARLESAPGASPLRISFAEPNGDRFVETIDPATYHEIAISRLDADGKTDETRMSDFRKVGSYVYAAVQERWIDGKLRTTTRVTDVRLDPGLLASFFRVPEDPKLGYMDYMGGLAAIQSRLPRPATGISLPTAGGK